MPFITVQLNITIPPSPVSRDESNSVEEAWAEKKKEARRLAQRLESASLPELSHDIEALYNCSEFVNSFVCPEHGTRRVQGRLCRERLCPICEWRRARTNQYIIQEVIAGMPSKTRLLHLVLTMKNCSGNELPDAIDNLFEAWRRLSRRKVINTVVLGSVRKLEVTYNAIEDTFHPHLHILMAVSPTYFGRGYISQERYRALWGAALRADYLPQVSVSAVKQGSHGNGIGLELGKYTVKPVADIDSLPAQAFLALKTALRNRRVIQYSGLLAEIRRSLASLPDDDTEGDELDSLDTCDICGNELKRIIKEWEGARYIPIE